MAPPLDSSPPEEPFVDGMTLGSGINAMTGELLGSPFKTSSVKEIEVVSKNSSEWLDRKIVKSSKELKRCVDINSLSSFAVPLHGLDLGLKSGFDFFDEHTSNSECTLIILTWERNFKSKRLSGGRVVQRGSLQVANRVARIVSRPLRGLLRLRDRVQEQDCRNVVSGSSQLNGYS